MREALWYIMVGSGLTCLTLTAGLVVNATAPEYKPTGLHYPKSFYTIPCNPCN